jgi:hypothetical protein
MAEEDMRVIHRYLRTEPPAKNDVDPPGANIER